ncbi:hypothetical protein [Maledivibacter halophilus]|uniref:Uncharacterized protein n=1 Tax=Maledivibacter halophilus TaxID=36842 RepID=A0A1T5KY00_9FIRM|nr:hypothetical protein [Maledivibacter halophilus]SKC68058.1 hypothetical protein SAMN02194393_02124 [Maledivibacter halophilus]SKC71886.1 hypothetical protein SAMN02194393_02528 [Maledivibacter halophilus]SKC80106.1 hypothetical protein SAMN02194393_03435 [Maledivibacter halophilus]
MKTLTNIGIRKQAQRFINSLSHATYELNGDEKQIDIFKSSIDDNTVKIYVYLDDSVEGEIDNIKLIDIDGDAIAHASRVFIKPSQKGLYTVFKYRFVEVEG